MRQTGRVLLRSAASATPAAKRHRLPLKKTRGTSGAIAPVGTQTAEAKDRRVCTDCGRDGTRLLLLEGALLLGGALLLKAALPVMPLRIANIVIAAAL